MANINTIKTSICQAVIPQCSSSSSVPEKRKPPLPSKEYIVSTGLRRWVKLDSPAMSPFVLCPILTDDVVAHAAVTIRTDQFLPKRVLVLQIEIVNHSKAVA